MKLGKIYESIISERLANVDSDVDMLYDKFFREDVETLKRTGMIVSGMFKSDETNTCILQSEEAIAGHDKNMAMIKVNSRGNNYDPKNRIIGIGVNRVAVDYIKYDFKGDYSAAIDYLDGHQKISLALEFNEDRIKGSIHHELAHWLDDTMNNGHIGKFVTKSNELTKGNNSKKQPINSTKIELQGQIHNVKQLYNKYKDVWDTLTFEELVNLSVTLGVVSRELKGDVKTQWLRDLKTRMHREGLLGKKMAN